MTIKRYLFILFSTLILTIAITQIVLLYVFKANIEDEIDKRGRDFADMLVNFAVENLDSPEQKDSSENELIVIQQDLKKRNLDFVIIEVEQEFDEQRVETAFEVPVEIITQEHKLKEAVAELPANAQHLIFKLSKRFNKGNAKRIKGENDDFEVKIFKPRNSQRYLVKQRLKDQIDRFKSKQQFHTETEIRDGGVVHRRKVEKHGHHHSNTKASLINHMFNTIFFLIAVTTVIALLMVFWLSRKFSEPLQQLSKGFKDLEDGNFGVKIKPRGVEEIKQTIERFNTMSAQLVKLAEAEHKLMQQTHLTELSDVSKGIAHALRNPMHTIGLAIEQLSQDEISEPLKQKLLKKVQSKIAQLDKNIKALLTVTLGEIDRNSEVVVLSVVNDIILELRQSHQLVDRELRLNVEIADDLTIRASEKELRSVLHTLVFNSYEASLEDQNGSIEISIKAFSKDDQLTITISDKGIGIEDKVMERMFEPHNSSKSEGAGMGLYISKRIAELYYDGKLSIANDHNEDKVTGVTATLVLKNNIEQE